MGGLMEVVHPFTPGPPTLSSMVIRSSDTLTGHDIPISIPSTWNEQPPLLQGPRKMDETTVLLKGMLRQGVPPALRCAVWISNVIQTTHPHQDSPYWHEYRTLSKVRALDEAYESLLHTIVSSEYQKSDLSITTDSSCVWDLLSAPTFGSTKNGTADDDLIIPDATAKGRSALKRVLIALGSVLNLDVAPTVPTLTALLLTTMSESYAFCTVREMVHRCEYYFPMSRREYIANCAAFGDVFRKLHKSTYSYLDDLGVMDNLDPFFQDLFVTLLPLPHVKRITDIYTLEGTKVIYRFGVALLVLYKMYSSEQLILISNANEWWKGIQFWAHSRQFDFELLVRKAYGVHGRGLSRQLRFPRRHILQRIIRIEEERLRERDLENGGATVEPQSSLVRPLGLVRKDVVGAGENKVSAITDSRNGGDDTPAKPILVEETAVRMHLANWLPLTLQMSNLELLYTTNTHGRSLEMLYRRCRDFCHTILVLEVLPRKRTTNNNEEKASSVSSNNNIVVGMYASQVWRASPHVFGNANCFLFRLSPTPACWKWKSSKPFQNSSSSALRKDDVDIHLDDEMRNINNNEIALLEQFMVGTRTYISMGGNHDGSAGLRLNEDLTIGESSPAAGFDNEPLPGIDFGSSVFDVGMVEVYGLVRSIDGRPA